MFLGIYSKKRGHLNGNMCICDWETVVEIEPAVMEIFDMPIGTDISLENENGRKYFMEQ